MSNKFVDEFVELEESDELVIVCCEYPKNGTEVYGTTVEPAIYVVERNPEISTLDTLKMRERFNPELRYYIVIVEKGITNEQIIRYAEQTKFNEKFMRL